MYLFIKNGCSKQWVKNSGCVKSFENQLLNELIVLGSVNNLKLLKSDDQQMILPNRKLWTSA